MAVTRMGRVAGREADFGRTSEETSTLKYIAVTDSRYDSEIVVATYGVANNILPTPYQSYHPDIVGHLCRGLRLRQVDGEPYHWDIEASFGTQASREENEENPLNRVPRISWMANQYRLAVDKDLNGQATINSAGDYFIPPVERDASHWVATVKTNVSVVPSYIVDYTDAVNNGSFIIDGQVIGQYVAKIVDIDISEVKFERTYSFREFSYSMEFRPVEKWHPVKVLNQGMRAIYDVAGADKRRQIVDGGTPPRPVSSPVPLDAAGMVLVNPTVATATYKSFSLYPLRSFNVLPGVV
jgi:hypothetical protein